MPKWLEATRLIWGSEDERKNKICIIGLTAHALSEIRDKCLVAGVNGGLNKPVRMQDLFKKIENCG